MEGNATQPSTQPYMDPRREGTKSMLNEQDEADVLCLLLPSSGPALKAVDLIAECAPQHILQNEHMDGVEGVEHDLSYDEENLMTRKMEEDSDDDTTQKMPPPAPSVGYKANGRPSRDIALRMSSRVHNPCLGFVFGRNTKRCDLLLSSDSLLKLSNCHFRIFVNRHGVLMLEDTSTNGTYVDKALLCSDHGNRKHENAPSTHTLNNGAIIELPTLTRQVEETIRFIVRFPSREHAQEDYNNRLASYLGYIQQAERQLQVAAQGKADMPPPVLLPFNPLKDQAEASPNASMLGAATGDTNHGLGWNGGNKYNVIKLIGKGAFAMVYKLSAKKDGEVYACKKIEKRRFIKDGVLNHKVHNEIMVMKDLEHTNIVKYIEYHETKAHIYIMMEFVRFGDLSIYTENGTAMAEYMCQTMALQILSALHYLHQRRITHRDIKPDNILVASHNPYTFKLSDFGLSKIVEDKTFLKSFCGTLLYCAPEIYPGFQRAKLGLHPSKRTRSGEPRVHKRTLPYEHSVDIWSIAAVLFHLLCGHAPYSGSMEDEGALMLINIMRTAPDWEYLAQAGISQRGVDFVKRSLVIDPQQRARETDLLRHPWLTGEDANPFDLLQATAGDDADALDASQLSIEEEPSEDHERIQNELEDRRETKRSRYCSDPDPEDPLDLFAGSAGFNHADWYGVSAYQWNDSERSNNNNQQQHAFAQATPGARLFGEIGSSVLRSSGVLGENINVALGMQAVGGSHAASDDSFMQPNLESVEGASFIPPDAHRENLDNTNAAITQDALQYPQLLPGHPYAGAAPSLEGAEALVDQMNMDSPSPSFSDISADSKPTTPKTPRSFEGSSSQADAGQSTGSTKVPSNQVTPKQQPIGVPVRESTASQPEDQQHDLRDSQMTSNGHEGLDSHGIEEHYHGSEQRPNPDSEYHSDAQHLYPSLPSTATNSQGSEKGEAEPEKSEASEEAHKEPSVNLTLGLPPTSGPTAETTTSHSAEPADVFAKPLPRYGVLRPISGSIPSKVIRLEQRLTSFGRDPKSTVVHEDSHDIRIPKNAIDILFWYDGIEKDIAKGKKNWHQNPNVLATISTRSHLYIKVNGVSLMRGMGGHLFGKLHKGDHVTIFGPPEPTEKDKGKYLSFKCDFLIGRSRYLRKASNPFKVLEYKDGRTSEYKPAKAPSKTSSQAGSVAPEKTGGSISARLGPKAKSMGPGA